jgi:hypothetical protein
MVDPIPKSARLYTGSVGSTNIIKLAVWWFGLIYGVQRFSTVISDQHK